MLGFGRSFHGGHTFGRLEGEIKGPIEEAPVPEKVMVPLKQGVGEEVLPLVKVGDKVRAGQLIGASDAVSSPVHATITGVVKHILKIDDGTGRQVTAVTLEGEPNRDFLRLPGAAPEFFKKKPEEIRALIYRSGASGLGKRGIPTQFKSSTVPLEKVKCVVVTALNSLPYGLSNSLYLKPRIAQFLKGLSVLNHALNNAPVFVAIDRAAADQAQYLRQAAKKFRWLRVVPLKPVYPQEHEAVLFRALFPRAGARRRAEMLEGAVLLEPQDVIQVQEAVAEGKPVIERTVALGGSAYLHGTAVRARIGTLVETLVDAQVKKELDYKVVVGNFLADEAPAQLAIPVTRTTSRITALSQPPNRNGNGFVWKGGLDLESHSPSFLSRWLPVLPRKAGTDLHGAPRECVSCGDCVAVCPVDLLPYHLARLVAGNKAKAARRYRLDACIECGLCGFVCPSKIPLLTQLRAGKEKTGG